MTDRQNGADEAGMMAFARRLAEAAREETLDRWREGCAAEDKGGARGFDPVPDADREAERAMRALIEARHPEHGIEGEEFPARPARGRLCWSLDPVDGTRAFTCGLPTWTTLIALLEDGRPLIGAIDAPAVDELCLGGPAGALLVRAGTEAPLRVSACRSVREARVSTTDPYLFDEAERAGWERVIGRARTARYGLDGYGYARVAAGTLDLVIESGLKPHDYNALVPVVRGAGGTFGDWQGGEDFTAGRVVAAATPELYEEAVALLAGAG